jgi:hypothetical protein
MGVFDEIKFGMMQKIWEKPFEKLKSALHWYAQHEPAQ